MNEGYRDIEGHRDIEGYHGIEGWSDVHPFFGIGSGSAGKPTNNG